MVIVYIILGIALLIAGRRLFWLFVAAAGFLAGFTLATQFIKSESQLLIWGIALIAGILGAVLAAFVQRLAVGLAGFIVGGYTLNIILASINLTLPEWVPYLIGGIIGAILVAALFDWALIILSSLTGASLLIQTFITRPWLETVLFIVLVLVGISAQASAMRAEHKHKPRPKKSTGSE